MSVANFDLKSKAFETIVLLRTYQFVLHFPGLPNQGNTVDILQWFVSVILRTPVDENISKLIATIADVLLSVLCFR